MKVYSPRVRGTRWSGPVCRKIRPVRSVCSCRSQYHSYHAKGLKPDARYHFYNRSLKYNIKDFGDLVNTVSPVHIKQDSLALDLIARFKKMDGEIEDCHAAGDMLMYHGVKLKQAFGGTGYNNEVRYFQDFAARMYFMEEEKEHADSGKAEK